ncbi:hypothetical protein BV25DRAFT_379649 [Artomyces pyxidatus]|uniref:Uncharacterized protein n=1 Tax=Artomyces pyxidatus TaxID=48021 RepID=A0ACB8T5T3_9AGAM|nr:hypothetical protein BV25DRAFT_379649 [Artomyces pyxidatus]
MSHFMVRLVRQSHSRAAQGLFRCLSLSSTSSLDSEDIALLGKVADHPSNTSKTPSTSHIFQATVVPSFELLDADQMGFPITLLGFFVIEQTKMAMKVSSSQTSNSSISRLPVEILDKIFCELQSFKQNDEESSKGVPRKPTCLAVSQVCAHWRAVARRCHALWTAIPLYSREWTDVCLELSKPYPITLRWVDDKGALPDEAALRLALGELPRIRELVLDVEPYLPLQGGTSFITVASDLLAQRPAPNLEVLDIRLQEAEHTLPDHIFSGQIPSALRTLKLDTCMANTSSPLFHSGLTELVLHDCMLWGTYQEMQETLLQTPQLEVLKLSYWCLPRTTQHIVLTGTPTVLSKLHTLELYGNTFEIALALRSISIPQACRQVALTYNTHEADFLEYSIITLPIEETFPLAIKAGSYFDRLTISMVDGSVSSVFLKLSEPVFTGKPNLPEELQLSLLRQPLGGIPKDAIPLAWAVLHRLRLSMLARTRVIETGYFSVDWLLDEEWWIRMDTFGGGIQEIVTRGLAACGLLKAFRRTSTVPDEFPGLFFPQLRDLTIESMQCDEEVFLELFAEQQRRRHAVGSTYRVSILRCDVTEGAAAKLRQASRVGFVLWDGDCRGYTTRDSCSGLSICI